MLWLNFLHLYQPANSDHHVIKEATEKSYLRIIRALEENPKIKFTFNITGCLFLRWQEMGYLHLIERLKKLIARGQLEITGSAAYHPLLPLVAEEECLWQIKENEKILKKYFGQNFKPKGFFFPEMAYSPKVAALVKKMGYQWMILDEISFSGQLNQVDCKKIYQDKVSGLKIIFRSRKLSRGYVPDIINKKLGQKIDNSIYVTATDGELYGLRHIDQTAEFERLLKKEGLKTMTISEYIYCQKDLVPTKIISASWESTEAELKNKNPYALWSDKKNKVQQKLWQLANLAYQTVEKNKKDKNYYWSRWHLVRGLASCTFWWASARDFKLFGSISWSPDEIERGINELIRAIRALDSRKTKNIKIKAEKLHLKIKQMIWSRHWQYYWKK